jgi:hypothetical protein
MSWAFEQTIETKTPEVNELWFDPNGATDFATYKDKWKLTEADTKRLVKEYGSIEEFKKQAKNYWDYQAASALPQINDTLTDLQTVKQAFEDAKWNPVKQALLMSQMASGMWEIWLKIQNIKKNQVFKYMLELKRGWATFWALSDQELKNIEAASPTSQINWSSTDTSLQTINKLLNSFERIKADMWKNNKFSSLYDYWNYDTNNSQINSWNSVWTWQQASWNSINYWGSTFNFNP